MPRIENFYISFDQQWSMYSPGETVQGNVYVDLSDAIGCDKIFVQFHGSARVFWVERKVRNNQYQPLTYQQEKVFYDNKTAIWSFSSRSAQQEGDEPYESEPLEADSAPAQPWRQIKSYNNRNGPHLNSGKHCFPFEFTLPENVPTSFEAESVPGYVRHVVKATICNGTVTKAAKQQTFAVVKPLQLNQIPHCDEPIITSEKNLLPSKGILSAESSGYIQAACSIEKSGFVPGDQIMATINVTNRSSRTIRSVKTRLVQIVTCYVFEPEFKSDVIRKTITSKVMNVTIAPGNTRKQSRHESDNNSGSIFLGPVRLLVPSVVPTFSVSDVLEARYSVVVEFYGKNKQYLQIEVPVYIATIPFNSNPPNTHANAVAQTDDADLTSIRTLELAPPTYSVFSGGGDPSDLPTYEECTLENHDQMRLTEIGNYLPLYPGQNVGKIN